MNWHRNCTAAIGCVFALVCCRSSQSGQSSTITKRAIAWTVMVQSQQCQTRLNHFVVVLPTKLTCQCQWRVCLVHMISTTSAPIPRLPTGIIDDCLESGLRVPHLNILTTKCCTTISTHNSFGEN